MPTFQEQFCSSNYSPEIPQALEQTSQLADSMAEVLNLERGEKSQEAFNFSLCSTLASLFQNVSYVVDMKSNLYIGILGATGSGKSHACDKAQDLVDYISEDSDITSIVPKTAVGFLKQIHHLHPLKSFAIFFEEMIKYKISERNYESFFNISLSLFENKQIKTHASLNATKNNDLPSQFEGINVSLIWNSTLQDLQNSYSEGVFQDDFFGRNLIFVIPTGLKKLKSKPMGLYQISYISRVKKRFYELKKIDFSLLSENLYQLEGKNYFRLEDEFECSLNVARRLDGKEYPEFARVVTIIKRLFNNIVFFEALMSAEVITINEIVSHVERILEDKEKVSNLFNYCKTLAFKSIHNVVDNSPYFSDIEGVERYPKKIIRNCRKIKDKLEEYIPRANEAHVTYIKSAYRKDKDLNKIYHEALNKTYRDDSYKMIDSEIAIRDDYICQGYIGRSFLLNITRDKRMLDSCLDYFRDQLGDDFWEIDVPMPANQGRHIKLYRLDFEGVHRVNILPRPYLDSDD